MTEDGKTKEVWSQDQGGLLFGYAFNTLDGGTIGFFEQTVLYKQQSWTFTALTRASGQAVSFAMTSQSEAEAVFENPAHDFPQKIRYYREGDWLKADVTDINDENGFSVALRPCPDNS